MAKTNSLNIPKSGKTVVSQKPTPVSIPKLPKTPPVATMLPNPRKKKGQL